MHLERVGFFFREAKKYEKSIEWYLLACERAPVNQDILNDTGLIFLFHFRSAFVAIFSIPVSILLSFLIMRWQGLGANIMSLGGIAISIGVLVDAAIIMVENAHKHYEEWRGKRSHFEIILRSAQEVGPTLFFTLLVITVSFLPVFSLEAQEGRLFQPLAWTKTLAMASATSAAGWASIGCTGRNSVSRNSASAAAPR